LITEQISGSARDYQDLPAPLAIPHPQPSKQATKPHIYASRLRA